MIVISSDEDEDYEPVKHASFMGPEIQVTAEVVTEKS